jgi:hypothetical protein
VQKVLVAFCQPTIERDCERFLQTITNIRNILTALRQETGVFAPESILTRKQNTCRIFIRTPNAALRSKKFQSKHMGKFKSDTKWLFARTLVFNIGLLILKYDNMVLAKITRTG